LDRIVSAHSGIIKTSPATLEAAAPIDLEFLPVRMSLRMVRRIHSECAGLHPIDISSIGWLRMDSFQ
jgi:hypothetical protein